jgi:O-antigen ligase
VNRPSAAPIGASVVTPQATSPFPLPAVRSTPRSDVYLFAVALLLIVFVSVIDVRNDLDRGEASRYLILMIPLAALAAVRLRQPSLIIRKPTVGDAALLTLFLFGLGGSLYGVIFLNTSSTARPVFVPLVLGLAPLLLLHRPSDTEVRRIFRWLYAIAVTYVVLNFVVNFNLIGNLLEYRQFRNASFAFVPLALACAVIRRHWMRLTALLVLLAGILATYPSATSALVLVGTGLTLFLTSARATGWRAVMVSLAVIVMTAFLLMNFQSAVNLASRYADLVDKAHTEAGRLKLWSEGLARFEESPIFGNYFADEIVVLRERDDKAIPYHNDFVLFLAEGGIVGAALLLTWIVWVEVALLRRHRQYRVAGHHERADLTRVILVALNGFFVAMAFNPVLSGITRSATIVGLSSIALSLGSPWKREPESTINVEYAAPSI